jgi:hypothetical protein
MNKSGGIWESWQKQQSLRTQQSLVETQRALATWWTHITTQALGHDEH